MQMLGDIDVSVAIPVVTAGESPTPAEIEFQAIKMRALRRKARRVSAYARWSTTMLNSLAAAVETDIAHQH